TPRDKTLEPGGNSVINVEAKDASGKPVTGSEVAVVVVDESVLALTEYKLDDPMAIFYADRKADVNDYHLRKNTQLQTTDTPFERLEMLASLSRSRNSASFGRMPGALAETVNVMASPTRTVLVTKSGTEESASKPIRLRENFNALA